MIPVKPVPKLDNIVPKLKKKTWLPPVVTKETGDVLRFFLAKCCYYHWYQCSFLEPWEVTLFFVTIGGSLPDCYKGALYAFLAHSLDYTDVVDGPCYMQKMR